MSDADKATSINGGGGSGAPQPPPSPTKRAPTLSDIASKLKISGSSSGSTPAESDASSNAASASQAQGEVGRLGLAGRLGASRSEAAPADAPSGSAGAGPSALSSSPTKRTESSVPSLEEIRERLSRKGLAHSKSAGKLPTKASLAADAASASAGTAAGADASATKSADPEPAKPPQVSVEAAPVAPSAPPAAASASAQAPAPASLEAKAAAPAAKPSGPPPSKPAAPTIGAAGAGKTTVVGPDGKKVHPLQHKWTLYFDSQSFNPSQAGAGSQTSTPSGTPQMSGSGAAAHVPYPTSLSSSPAQQANVPPSPAPTGPPVTAPATWEAALRMLGAYNDVESFFGTFSTLRRPSQLEKASNYHLFKDGIKPMWEDRRNANGGKWTLTLKATNNPALLDRSWMWLVLALIGEELDPHDMITGAVCSVRAKGDRLSIWTRTKDDVAKLNELARRFVSILDLEKEPGVGLEFSYNTGQSLPQPHGFWHFYNPPVPAAGHAHGPPGGRQHAGGGFGATSPPATHGKAAFSPPHGHGHGHGHAPGMGRSAFAGPPGSGAAGGGLGGASVLRRGQSGENPFARASKPAGADAPELSTSPSKGAGILGRAGTAAAPTTADGPRPILGSSSPVKRGGALPQ